MGRIGTIITSFIQKIPGFSNDAQFSSIEAFAGDERTYQVYGPCNEDFSPPDGVKALNKGIGRQGGLLLSYAYVNEAIVPVTVSGERRPYSTNKAGDTIMAEIYLKQDGTILIKNDALTITANPSGVLEIETDGNTEITSAKTVINNDLEVKGNIDLTGIITGSDVFNGADSDKHVHDQANDSGGNTEEDTGVAK